MKKPKPYCGELDPRHAATLMQAARWNALDLLDTAEILYSLKRLAHSVFFSTLAIEEAGKHEMLLRIFLGFGGDRSKLWQDYRRHKAKTECLNPAIEARVRVHFPEKTDAEVKEIGKAGPTPDELEFDKQLAIYSDCLERDDEPACHLPRNRDWRQAAWDRLCEAKAIVHPLRDYPPEELEVWLKHAKDAQARGGRFQEIMKPLHAELLEKGFIKEGQWKVLLNYLEALEQENEGD